MGWVIREYFVARGGNDSSPVDWKCRKEIVSVQEKETLWQSESSNEKRVVPGGVFAFPEEGGPEGEWSLDRDATGGASVRWISSHPVIHMSILSTFYDVTGIFKGHWTSQLLPVSPSPPAPHHYCPHRIPLRLCPLAPQAGAAAGQVLGSAGHLLAPALLSHFCFGD